MKNLAVVAGSKRGWSRRKQAAEAAERLAESYRFVIADLDRDLVALAAKKHLVQDDLDRIDCQLAEIRG